MKKKCWLSLDRFFQEMPSDLRLKSKMLLASFASFTTFLANNFKAVERPLINTLEDSGDYFFQKHVERIRMTSCGATTGNYQIRQHEGVSLGLLKNVSPTVILSMTLSWTKVHRSEIQADIPAAADIRAYSLFTGTGQALLKSRLHRL